MTVFYLAFNGQTIHSKIFACVLNLLIKTIQPQLSKMKIYSENLPPLTNQIYLLQETVMLSNLLSSLGHFTLNIALNSDHSIDPNNHPVSMA